MGKSSGKNFTEGWIEFEDKGVAKQVAQMLNGQPMGGKRRSAYHYDLWCLKYLSKFKWDHLTEEIGKQELSASQTLLAAAKHPHHEDTHKHVMICCARQSSFEGVEVDVPGSF